jgi:glutathione S-transferase
MDYLEGEAPARGFRFGDALSIGDVAVAAFFRNAAFARWRIDAERWPKTARWIGDVLAHDAFAQLVPFEERMIRTPIPKQRDALAEMGAPILAETYGTATPRRGVMPIG